MNIPELGIFEGMEQQRLENVSATDFAVVGRCRSCKADQRIIVPKDGYNRWKAGDYVQNALPMLSADIRELLISGFCGKCFDEICAEPTDE